MANINSQETPTTTELTSFSSYEIENFMKVMTDYSGGDPFKVLTDPTFSGFKIFFHFDATSGLLADESHLNSALAYLKRIGQSERYDLLKRFIQVLSMVNSITPWIFQEITGLGDIHSVKKSDVLFKDHQLHINTLETLDGKIQSLIHMYREISFDYNRMVHVLPINLRRFSMSIYIYDFRMFSTESPTASAFLQTLKNTDIKRLNHTLFDLGYCEFSEDSGKNYFDSITNNPTEESKSNLSINCSKVVISSMFRSITGNRELTASAYDLITASMKNSANIADFVGQEKKWIDRIEETTSVLKQQDTNTITNPETKLPVESQQSIISRKAKEIVAMGKNAIKEAPSYIADQAKDIAKDIVTSKLNGLFMGNVYGFSVAENIRRLQRINDLRSAYESLPQNSAIANNDRIQSLNVQQSANLGNINS